MNLDELHARLNGDLPPASHSEMLYCLAQLSGEVIRLRDRLERLERTASQAATNRGNTE